MKYRRPPFRLRDLLVAPLIFLVILIVGFFRYNAIQYDKQMALMHEQNALRVIESIQTAETQYQAQYGKFATRLAQLGTPPAGDLGPDAAGLIPNGIAEGHVYDYSLTLAPRKAGYVIQATPNKVDRPGRFTFYSDETLVIRRNPAPDPATAASPQIR